MPESPASSDPLGLHESDLPAAADEWDAGLMGCGEVIILLRKRMQELKAGDVFKLTASDLGAPEDIPAWCRMTSRRLLRAEHPHYWIEAKTG